MRLKLTAILVVLLACVALYADPCPYCGEEVVLTKAAPTDIKAQVWAFEAQMSEALR